MKKATKKAVKKKSVSWRSSLWSFSLYIIGLAPALYLLIEGVEGQLGSDPVNVFERSLGLWAFRFLILCLVITPLYQKTGLNFLQYRRLMGLLSILYAGFHFLAYFGLEAGFNFASLVQHIVHYPFMILGLVAFILLIPLAVTSNSFSMRFLGKKWKKLHLLVFPALCLGAIHFYLSFKLWEDVSLFYDSIALLLIFVRIPIWWKQARRKISRI